MTANRDPEVRQVRRSGRGKARARARVIGNVMGSETETILMATIMMMIMMMTTTMTVMMIIAPANDHRGHHLGITKRIDMDTIHDGTDVHHPGHVGDNKVLEC